MKRLFSFLTVLAIIVVCLGFYRGWFTVSGSREAEGNKVDVSLTVDADKVKKDAESVKEKAAKLTGKATEGATDFGNQAGDDAKSKKE